MKVIVAQNGAISVNAIKCISFSETEGHLAVEYIDGTMTEAVFNNQAEAKQALLGFINQNEVLTEWDTELVAPQD